MTRYAVVFHRNAEIARADEVVPMLEAGVVTRLTQGLIHVEGALGAGSQPFVHEQRTMQQPFVTSEYVVVASLRLDNRDTLLPQAGFDAVDKHDVSDIELLLACYRRWGDECPTYLVGAFAFVIWDRRRQVLFAARDHIGEYGFCYYVDESLVVLATEITQIHAHASVRRRFNDRLIAEVLLFKFQTENESYFADIQICPPAHCLVADTNSVKLWRYWDFSTEAELHYSSDQEYADHVVSLLRRSVDNRLNVQGTVGLALSGGRDSSLLAAIMADYAQQQGKHLPTFTYRFDELPALDERRYVKQTAEYLDLTVTDVLSDQHYERIYMWPADPDGIHLNVYSRYQWHLYEVARAQGCDYIATGFYGDHLFEGNHLWAAAFLEQWQLGRLLKWSLLYKHDIEWIDTFVKRGVWPLLPHYMRNAVYGRRRKEQLLARASHLHPDLIQRTGIIEYLLPTYLATPGNVIDVFRRQAVFNRDLGHLFLGQRYYRALGLQLITPYADLELIKFAFSLPEDQLYRPGWTRWVQRNAMRGLVPEAVRTRRDKTTFYPMQQRFLQEQRREIQQLLTDPLIVELRYVRSDWLQALLADPSKWMIRGRDATDIVGCVATEVWLRKMLGVPVLANV